METFLIEDCSGIRLHDSNSEVVYLNFSFFKSGIVLGMMKSGWYPIIDRSKEEVVGVTPVLTTDWEGDQVTDRTPYKSKDKY